MFGEPNKRLKLLGGGANIGFDMLPYRTRINSKENTITCEVNLLLDEKSVTVKSSICKEGCPGGANKVRESCLSLLKAVME